MKKESTELTVVEHAALALNSSETREKLAELVEQSQSIVEIKNPAGRSECHAAAMAFDRIITLDSVESSQIAAIGHDAETNILAIRFKSKSGAKGSLYEYDNVSADEFAAFRDAASIGSYFYKNIKPFPEKYPYTKIVEEPSESAVCREVGRST